jgi:hypothetical protein
VIVQKLSNYFGFPFLGSVNYGRLDGALKKLSLANLNLKVFGKKLNPTLIVIIKTDMELKHFMSTLSSNLDGLSAGDHVLSGKTYEIYDISTICSGQYGNGFSESGFDILKDMYSEIWPVSPSTPGQPGAHHHISPSPSDFSKYHHAMHGVVSHSSSGSQGPMPLPDPSPTDDTVVVLLHGKSRILQIFMEDAIDQYGNQFHRFPFFGNRAYSEIVSTLSRIPNINFDFPKHYKIVYLGKNKNHNNNEYAILVHAIDQRIADGVKSFIQSYIPFVTNRLIFNDQNFSQIYQSAARRQPTISISAAPIITDYIDEHGNLKP